MSNLKNTSERLRTLAVELPENQKNTLNQAVLEIETFLKDSSSKSNRLIDEISKVIEIYQIFPDNNRFHLIELKSFASKVTKYQKEFEREYINILKKQLNAEKEIKTLLVSKHV